MKSTLIVAITIAALVGPRPAEAASGIAVTSDVEGDRIERPLAAGEIVPVTFFVSSEDGDLVLGLEFALACKGEEIRIHAVEFNPAFPFSLPPQEPALPASHFRTIRLQSPADPDESFAEPGVPVWFATAELEVLQATPFESAVSFCARGVVARGQGYPSAGSGSAAAGRPHVSGTITVANIDQPPAPQTNPWTYEYADVLLEVRPVGGDAPLTELAPYTTYEVHYQADYDRVNVYILFAVATSPNHGFAAASAPPAGDWSDTGRFHFEDIEQEWGEPSTAAGYPDGYLRYQMATDDFYWPTEDDPTPFAGPQGHLCNITTQSPGELNLHLYAVWIDDSEYLIVEMQTQGTYMVAE